MRLFNLFRSFKVQCVKIFSAPLAAVCVLMVTALCCFSNIYTDSESGMEYSLLTLLALGKYAETVSNTQTSEIFCEYVIRAGFSDWLVMFAPIICVLPFAKSLSAVKASCKRFEMVRCGKNAFVLSKFTAGALSSGFILTLGYGIFMLLSVLMFPSAASAGMNVGMSTPQFIFSRLFGAFFVGVVCFIPAYLVSIFSSNKYMVLCIPFMLLHFYNLVIEKIADGKTADIKKFIQILRVKGIFRAFDYELVRYDILIVCLLILISVLSGITAVHKRTDCCEKS